MPRPTILQIIPRLDTGGAELSTLEITDAIARAGGRALIATEGGRVEADAVRLGGEIVRMAAGSKSPLRMLANARALQQLIRSERIDLLHARSRAPAWSALLAARRAGVPFVTTYHGAYGESGALKRLYNSVMARSDIVIANSAYTADLIRARYGTPAERIRVIHRGIDVAHFDPDSIVEARAAALRQHWGIAAGVRIILHAARLTAWKGQTAVIEAAGLLRERGLLDNVAIVLAGDAQGRQAYVQALHARIAEFGLEDHVRLVGHVADMPAAYKLAHLTVVASVEPEAFGRAAIEAQAMGSPVIATDLGAPPETVLSMPRASSERITGWLVEPGNAASLAQRLADALSLSEADRAAIGERARLHVREHFALDAMKVRTLEVYDTLLGSGLAMRFAAAKADPEIFTGVRGPA